jgi:modulator of FtsH protease
LLAAYSTDAWVNLMIAEAGASAALTGLVFVAVSINLQKVLSYPSLPGRAGESIALLFSVLIIATFCLVPNLSTAMLGWELLILGAGQWMTLNVMHARYLRGRRAEPWHWMGTRILFNQLASLPVAIAGISLLLHAGGGLYWLLPGILFSLIAGVFHAWVLLVEIMR